MTEINRILDGLAELKEALTEPASHMELLRKAVAGEIQRVKHPQIHLPATPEQREYLRSNIDKLESFLLSDDGRDAIELLMAALRDYCEKPEPAYEEPSEAEVAAE